MLGLRLCPRGRLLVVLAVAAVAAIALVPRGLVRATAASQLPEVSEVSELSAVSDIADSVDQTPEDDLPLPGVRAVVAREEQDAAYLVIRLVTSSPMDDVTAVLDGAPTWRLPDEGHPPPVCADPPRACGPRAPPRSI